MVAGARGLPGLSATPESMGACILHSMDWHRLWDSYKNHIFSLSLCVSLLFHPSTNHLTRLYVATDRARFVKSQNSCAQCFPQDGSIRRDTGEIFGNTELHTSDKRSVGLTFTTIPSSFTPLIFFIT